jgi:hypothetical protein
MEWRDSTTPFAQPKPKSKISPLGEGLHEWPALAENGQVR